MSSFRYGRYRPNPGRSNMSSWMSLLFLLVTLIMLIMSKDKLADGAASCFVNLSSPVSEQAVQPDEEPAGFEIQVKRAPQIPSDARYDAGDVTP